MHLEIEISKFRSPDFSKKKDFLIKNQNVLISFRMVQLTFLDTFRGPNSSQGEVEANNRQEMLLW